MIWIGADVRVDTFFNVLNPENHSSCLAHNLIFVSIRFLDGIFFEQKTEHYVRDKMLGKNLRLREIAQNNKRLHGNDTLHTQSR